ncbi:MAG: hypothetical protein IKE42_15070 [Aquamicrobium sp.]|nr:hypothetical protein [Aquamicrobium sp.]
MANKEEMVNITFTETRVVQDEHAGTAREARFEADESYDLNPRSADRWVKRGVAYFTSEKDAVAKGASSEPPADDAESVDLEKLTKTQLEKLAAERGVNVVGAKSKADFLEAFRMHDEANAPFDYDAATDDDLKAEADRRGVDFSSITSRDEAVAALKAAQAPAE